MGLVTRDRSQGQSLALFWSSSDAVIIPNALAIRVSQILRGSDKVRTTLGALVCRCVVAAKSTPLIPNRADLPTHRSLELIYLQLSALAWPC